MGIEEGSKGDFGLYVYHFRYIILAFLFFLLLGTVFQLGRLMECKQSGGYRYAGKCVGIASVDVCEDREGNKYVMNNSYVLSGLE